jgi:hypothetical protein
LRRPKLSAIKGSSAPEEEEEVSSYIYIIYMGWDSSVGIATDYGLDCLGDRIPVGARFFAHAQTGPEAHPASCTMGKGSFPRVKQPGLGADHQPPPSIEVEND